MELENQVVSLELSKRLSELGVKQESLFYWHEGSGNVDFYNHFSPSDRDYSAFTVAELGEMLPPFYRTMNIGKLGKPWFESEQWIEKDPQFYAPTEADARAKMLVYLLENKLVTPEGSK